MSEVKLKSPQDFKGGVPSEIWEYIEKLHTRISEYATLHAKADRLAEALRKAKRGHYYCDDPWYSCPKDSDGCADESQGEDCNCGTDRFNAEIDTVLAEWETK